MVFIPFYIGKAGVERTVFVPEKQHLRLKKKAHGKIQHATCIAAAVNGWRQKKVPQVCSATLIKK